MSLSECEDNLYLPSLDAKKLWQLLEGEYYNPNILGLISCILKNITTPGENGNNIRLLRYLQFDRMISSGYGKINGVKMFKISSSHHFNTKFPSKPPDIIGELQNIAKQNRNILYPYALFRSSPSLEDRKITFSMIGFEKEKESPSDVTYYLSQIPPNNSITVKEFVDKNFITAENMAELMLQYLFSYRQIIQNPVLFRTIQIDQIPLCNIVILPQKITLKYPLEKKKIETNHLLLIPLNLTYHPENPYKDENDLLARQIAFMNGFLSGISIRKETYGKVYPIVKYYDNSLEPGLMNPLGSLIYLKSWGDILDLSQFSPGVKDLSDFDVTPICNEFPCKEDLTFPFAKVVSEIYNYLDLYEYLRCGGDISKVNYQQRKILQNLWNDIDAMNKEITTSLNNLRIPNVQDVRNPPQASDDNPTFDPEEEMGDIKLRFVRKLSQAVFWIKEIDLKIIHLKRISQCSEYIGRKVLQLRSPDTENKIANIIRSLEREINNKKAIILDDINEYYSWTDGRSHFYEVRFEKYKTLEGIP